MKKLILFISSFFILQVIFGQNRITYNGSGNYTLKERSDLRRYDNGKYIGLMSREVTSFITPTGYKNGYTYEGSFFVMEATKRASESVGHGIKDSIPSSFKIGLVYVNNLVNTNSEIPALPGRGTSPVII